MKYCEYCGAEVNEQAVVCVKCGCAIKSAQSKSNNSGLFLAAKVLMIITCVIYPTTGLFTGLLILSISALSATAVTSTVIIGIMYMIFISLTIAWCLPMTIVLSRKIKHNESIGVGFKICTLLFVNTLAGILLLCAVDNN